MSFKDHAAQIVSPDERVRDAEKITRLMENSPIGIYDADHREFFKQFDKQLKDVKGILPQIDLIGFDQEAKDHSTGLEKLWHGVKELFSLHHQTLDEQIQEKVVQQMKDSKDPREQAKYKAYEAEEKAIQKYQDEVHRWGMQMTINPGKFPEAPDCPMHDEVRRRAQLEEKQIVAEVRSHMTPEERRQVDADAKKYLEGVENRYKNEDPYGTGGFRPLPQPSEALAKYWRHIQEQTDVHTNH
ncbi:MAG: hypothetical protein JST89_09275 [Cyanobacteria bacterium SZAS-4]|nr:hypothetical protein [Cyanobacteria bacterium SZAS-4]